MKKRFVQSHQEFVSWNNTTITISSFIFLQIIGSFVKIKKGVFKNANFVQKHDYYLYFPQIAYYTISQKRFVLKCMNFCI